MAKINQDRGCVVTPIGPDKEEYKMVLFCVYDGHGATGEVVPGHEWAAGGEYEGTGRGRPTPVTSPR